MVHKKSGISITIILTALLMLIFSSSAWADEKIEASKQFNNGCFKCHGAKGLKSYNHGKTISLYVNEQVFKDSIHGTNSCATCHQGITMYPHNNVNYGREFVKEVNKRCQACHADITKVYQNSVHGQLLEKGKDTALCSDCHGVHDIYKGQDARSNINGNKQTESCLKCHEEIEESYMESFHGKAVYLGSKEAARCSDCHGSHEILGPDDPNSSVNEKNTPTTCSKCHAKPYENFANGTEHFTLKKDGPGTSKIMHYTLKFFSWLLFLVINFCMLFMLSGLWRKYKNLKK